jgi:hypothetical protein
MMSVIVQLSADTVMEATRGWELGMWVAVTHSLYIKFQ